MAKEVFLGSVYGTLEMRTEKWESGIKDARSHLDSFEKTTNTRLAAIGESFVSAGKKLSLGLTAPLVLFGKQSVNTAIEVEVAWKELEKVYGSTADSFERDQKMLSSAVDDLAVKFGFQKVATLDALGAISAMGYEGSKAIELLSQSMEFARTGNMELNEAMEGAVAISKIYNVEGEKLRANLALLNTVENATGASMRDLNEAIQIAGASGQTAGVSIDELSGYIAALRERAIPAGEAANALKTIFTRVYNVTDEAQKVYDKFNISVLESTKVTGTHTVKTSENSAEVKRLTGVIKSHASAISDYQNGIKGVNLEEDARKKKIEQLTKEMNNAQSALGQLGAGTKTVSGTFEVLTGQFKQADKVLEDLAKSWDKMTDAEKYEVIQSNAGIYQKDKFINIMEDLTAKNSTYYKTLSAVGDETQNLTTYEKEMAVFLETKRVKLEQANVAFTNMKTAVGSLILEAVLPFINKLSEMAKSFGGLNVESQRAVVYIGLFAAALGPLLIFLGQVLIAVGAIKNALIALWAVTVAHPLVALATAVAAVTVFIGLLIANLDLLKSKSELVSVAMDKEKDAKDRLRVATDGLKDADDRLNGAKLSLEGATLRLERATKTAKDMTEKYGAQSLEAREAELNRKQAEEDLKTAQDNLNESVDLGKQAIEEYDAASEESKKAAEELAKAQEAPESAFARLRDRIGEAINKLKEWLRESANKVEQDARNNQGVLGGRARGGWINTTGPYTMHSGEYVLSKDMLSGKKAASIDTSKLVGNQGGSPSGGSPTFNVTIGMYAGSEIEKRQIAKDLYDSLQDYNTGAGLTVTGV